MKKLFGLILLAASTAFAQTTYTLGDGGCHVGWVDCQGAPSSDGTKISNYTIFLMPFQGPYAEDFIEGIPGFTNGWAECVNDSTYQITYAQVINPINHSQQQVPAVISCNLIQIIVTGSYTTEVGPLTGTANINFGDYYYTNTRYNVGWHWSVTGGTITVN